MQRLNSTTDATLNQNFQRIQAAVGALEAAIGEGGGGSDLWTAAGTLLKTTTPDQGILLGNAPLGWDDGSGTDTIGSQITGAFGGLVLNAPGMVQFVVAGGQVGLLDATGLQLQRTVTVGNTGGADGTRPGEIQWNGTALQVWNGTAWLTVTAA